MVQEHIVVTDGLKQTYVGEFSVNQGTGEAISEGLLEFVQAKEGLNIDEVSILWADSTAVNTESENGVIAKVEQKMKRPFHRFLCISI